MFQAGELQSFLEEKGVARQRRRLIRDHRAPFAESRGAASLAECAGLPAHLRFGISANRDRWTSNLQIRRRSAAQPVPRWEFIALAAALMALNCAGHRHHAAGAAADRRQPRRRERKPPAVCDHRLYSRASAGGQLFYGPVSDRFGRRAPLVVGLVIYVAAALRRPSRRASHASARAALRPGHRRGGDARHRRLDRPRHVRRPAHGRGHVAGHSWCSWSSRSSRPASARS